MLLKEILDMVAQPYTWLDEDRAIFELDGVGYGILVIRTRIRLNDGFTFTAANISFGILKNKNFESGNDLDVNLTKFGKPRTVLSTVAEACIANKKIIDCEVICLASNDSVKQKRTLIYSFALGEIRHRVKEFEDANDITVKTKYGAILVLLSKITFSEKQKAELALRLKIEAKEIIQ